MLKFIILLCVVLAGCSSNNKKQRNILVVLSGETQLKLKGNKIFKTGFFLNELMIPVMEMQNKGIKLTFITPKGNNPKMDKGSDSASFFASTEEYIKAKTLLKQLALTTDKKAISSFSEVNKIGLKNFDGIFVPGGHAPMIDLAKSKELGKILTHFHKGKKPTALVCHGLVALLSALENDKTWIYKGYKMTVFSDKEEMIAEKTKLKGRVPFYPERALRKAGGKIQNAKEWKSNVVVDRELITGQNPSSDRALVEKFLKKL